MGREAIILGHLNGSSEGKFKICFPRNIVYNMKVKVEK